MRNEKWEPHLELKDCPYCWNHDWVCYDSDKDMYKCRECGNVFSYSDINGIEKNKDKPTISKDVIDEVARYEKETEKIIQDKCDNQLKNGCPFKDKLNEYFGKYRIGLCASRHDYTKEEFNIRYCTLMDLEKCVANAYTDLIMKGEH